MAERRSAGLDITFSDDSMRRDICARAYQIHKFPQWRVEQLQQFYGLTVEEYIAMAEAQDYACAICGVYQTRVRMSVDHSHMTGHIRGLLCEGCNYGLGCYGDHPEKLRQAADYAEKHRDLARINPENGRTVPNFSPARHLMMSGKQVEAEKQGLFVRPEFVQVAPPKHKPRDVTEEIRAKLATVEEDELVTA